MFEIKEKELLKYILFSTQWNFVGKLSLLAHEASVH